MLRNRINVLNVPYFCGFSGMDLWQEGLTLDRGVINADNEIEKGNERRKAYTYIKTT